MLMSYATLQPPVEQKPYADGCMVLLRNNVNTEQFKFKGTLKVNLKLSKAETLGLCDNQLTIPCENRAVVNEKKTKLRNWSGTLCPVPWCLPQMTSAHLIRILDYRPRLKMN